MKSFADIPTPPKKKQKKTRIFIFWLMQKLGFGCSEPYKSQKYQNISLILTLPFVLVFSKKSFYTGNSASPPSVRFWKMGQKGGGGGGRINDILWYASVFGHKTIYENKTFQNAESNKKIGFIQYFFWEIIVSSIL